jgi:hypothetical protein
MRKVCPLFYVAFLVNEENGQETATKKEDGKKIMLGALARALKSCRVAVGRGRRALSGQA